MAGAASAQAVSVTGISPSSGPSAGGTSVAITGAGFTGATAVKFGATAATSFTVNSDTSISAFAPAGSGTVDVTVTAPGGTSATSSADQFTYLARPVVGSISPSSGYELGGTSVTINGAGFTGATAVQFGGTPAYSFSVLSDQRIVATTARGTGTVHVTITTPNGTSATSSADQFTFVPPPSLTSISPTSGPSTGGTSVTINGTNLTGATSVTFGANAATDVTVVSATQITAKSPAGSGVADVRVVTPYGTSPTSSADQFTYILPPAVTNLSPNRFPSAGGTTVTITGTAFTDATAVMFGSTAATSFTLNSANSITAVTPSGSGTGSVLVTTPIGTSASGGPSSYTYADAPTVSSISPAAGPTTGGASVVITGTGFVTRGGTTVKFGTVSATSVTFNSATQVTAVAPAGSAGAVDVTATTAGGTSATSAAARFTYTPAPTVTAISPSSGATTGGTSVTITGTNLSGVTAVAIGGTAATSFTVNSATQITAVVPARAATGAVDVKVTSAGGAATLTAGFTYTAQAIVLTPPSPPNVTVTLTPSAVPNATMGQVYSQSITASGGVAPYSYSVDSGALPAGMTLSSSGLLSGSPAAGGAFNFAIKATDSSGGSGPFSGTMAYSMTVAAPTITVTPSTLASPTTGQAYSQTLTASGGVGAYSYRVGAGALPTGLSLSAAGVLSGTPTAGGTFNVTIIATDSATGAGPYSGTQSYALTVNAPTITVTPTIAPNAVRGQVYSHTFSASGGVGTYSYGVSAGALPAGLTLSPAGVLSGTPTQIGSFSFTVRATDSTTGAGPYAGAASVTLTVSGATIAVTPTTLPSVLEGSNFSQTFSAAGGVGPYSYAVTSGALPGGMALSSGGVLSGQPAADGAYGFTVTATDSFGNTGATALTLSVTTRPNPAADPEVRGLASAQAEATRRLVDTQVGGFTRRMEQLHAPGAGSSMNLSLDGSAFMAPDDPWRTGGALDRVMGQGALAQLNDRVAAFAPRTPMGAHTNVTEPVAPMDASSEAPRSRGPVRVWVGGVISLGERKAGGGAAKLSIHSNGVSLGSDVSVNDQLDAGFGVGFGQEQTDVGASGSRMETRSWVGVGYASWRPRPGTFLDGLVGRGNLVLDTRRKVSVDSATVLGRRDGQTTFGSLTGGLDLARGPVRWVGYARMQIMEAGLDAYVETGSPLWALAYANRNISSRQGALGLHYSRAVERRDMTWTLGARGEWTQEFGDAGVQSIRYADWLGGDVYALDLGGWGRGEAILGFSLKGRASNGWSVDAETEAHLSRRQTIGTLRLFLTKAF